MIPTISAVSSTAITPLNEINNEIEVSDGAEMGITAPFFELLQTLDGSVKKAVRANPLLVSLSESEKPDLPLPQMAVVTVPCEDPAFVSVEEQPDLPLPQMAVVTVPYEDPAFVSVEEPILLVQKPVNSSALDLVTRQLNLLDSVAALPSVVFGERGEGIIKGDLSVSDPTIMGSRLAVPMSSPGWGAMLGQRLQLAMQQQTNSIQIRLDPPELGKLDVQIQVDDSGTQVIFHTEQREVKEALERAFPRLHEMLSMDKESGLGFQFGSQHGFQSDGSEEEGRDVDEQGAELVQVEGVYDQGLKNTALLSAIDFYV